ncbi:MAG: GlsB/YeaQ/YmgE family stress response membrane protein [Shimia sp.]
MGLGIILSIIVGGLAGWIASNIMNSDTGLFANIGLGILGAVVLNFILGLFGIYARSAFLPQLLVAIAGACLLIWGYRTIKSR